MSFAGKRVLVTGGTRGIGRAAVEASLRMGARVAVNGSSESSVAKVPAELKAGERSAAAPSSPLFVRPTKRRCRGGRLHRSPSIGRLLTRGG
jgi:NAD(P)-dependent dehydrogenase (short-subunit alcohol dehydrogenase family)